MDIDIPRNSFKWGGKNTDEGKNLELESHDKSLNPSPIT